MCVLNTPDRELSIIHMELKVHGDPDRAKATHPAAATLNQATSLLTKATVVRARRGFE